MACSAIPSRQPVFKALLYSLRLAKRCRPERLVQQQPHLHIMTSLAPHMGKTHFVRWTVKASALPPQWNDARRRVVSDPSRPAA